MELTHDRGKGHYIDSYQEGYLEVDKIRYESSLIVAAKSIEAWRPKTLADLSAADLAPLLALKPKILLLGTGKSFQFPSNELLAPFYAAQIGIEIMDTAAACRTYNILMSEERAVIAALLIE